MELVSYTYSTKPFSSLPRDGLFVQAPDSSALSNAVFPDPPPASSQTHHLNLFKKGVTEVNLHILHITPLELLLPNSSLLQLSPVKMALLLCQRNEIKLKSWESSWNDRMVALGSRKTGLSFPVSLLTSQCLESLVCIMGMKVLYFQYPSHFLKSLPTQRRMIEPSPQFPIIHPHIGTRS